MIPASLKMNYIEELKKLITKEWVFGDQVLVEKFVPGREITVGVLNNKALAVTEIKSKKVFYDYESKYNEKESEHLIPAPLPPNKYKEAMDISLKAHEILGCKSISRSDIRYDDSSGNGKFYLMEVNTQPGFTPNSLVPEQAAYLGISFEEVIKFLKGRFPDAYKKALKEAEDDPFIKESGNPAEGAIIPSMIWGYVEDDDEFYSAVENWFKENYPGDELK